MGEPSRAAQAQAERAAVDVDAIAQHVAGRLVGDYRQHVRLDARRGKRRRVQAE